MSRRRRTQRRLTRRKDLLDHPDEIAKMLNGNLSQRLGLLRTILEDQGLEWGDIELDMFEAVRSDGSPVPHPLLLGHSIVAEILNRQRRVDHREHWLMLDYLADLGFEITHLHTGDVSSRRVVIERKEDDLVSSLFDGRRLRQLGAMRENAEFSFLVITKSWDDVKKDAAERGLSTRTLIGYIASMCSCGYPPLFIDDHFDASTLMHRIVEKIEDDVPRLYVARPDKPNAVEYRDAIVEALPKVGLKTRRKLMDRFGSLAGLCRATVEELREIEGIGEATANRIIEILHHGED